MIPSPEIIVLFELMGSIALFVFSFLLIRGMKGVVEEEQIRIPVFVTPASKIIRLILLNVAKSFETILIVSALILISLSTAYASSYLYSSMTIDASSIPYTYDILLIANKYIENFQEAYINGSASYIKIVQLYNGIIVDYNGKSYYLLPLLINCHIYKVSSSGIGIDDICLLTKQKNVAIIDEKSGLNIDSISVGLQKFSLVKADLSIFAKTELLPGIYLLHSLGAIGGLSISALPTNIIIFHESRDLLGSLCETQCDAKTLLLIRSDVDSRLMKISELLNNFSIVAFRQNNKIYLYSSNLIPSPKTFIGVGLSMIFSLAFAVSVSGGLAEKIKLISQRLALFGVTAAMLSSSLVMAMIITFLLFYIPLMIITTLNGTIMVASITYLLSSTLSTAVIVFRATSSLKPRGAKIQLTPSTALSSPIKLDINSFRTEIEKSILIDDFFALTELEVLEDTHDSIEIRIELTYRKSLSSIITIEIIGERSNGIWSYNLLADVWSLEELSKNENDKLISMALSKIQGVLSKCIIE